MAFIAAWFTAGLKPQADGVKGFTAWTRGQLRVARKLSTAQERQVYPAIARQARAESVHVFS